MRKIRVCSVDECFKKHLAKGLCQYHYGKKRVETPEGKEYHDSGRRKHAQSPKGKERMREYQKSEVGRAIHIEENRKYRNSLSGRIKRRLWDKGLSPEEQERATKAFMEFDGKCQCCGSLNHSGKDWHLDHKDEKFRGILCHLCNCAAAFLRDDIAVCEQMIEYLRKTKCQ